MIQASAQTRASAISLTRSAIYKLMAKAFMYPTEEMARSFKSGELRSELLSRISSLPHAEMIKELMEEPTSRTYTRPESISLADLEVDFVKTFDVGSPEPPFPPYEGAQRQGASKTAVMLEVSAFYKHFGLAMNTSGGENELPDHLCAELEFLHFLTFKEAQARSELTAELMEGYVRAQRDFLSRHLTQWVPDFAKRLSHSGSAPFYAELARITSSFILSEVYWLDSIAREIT